jgi:hypothetical protein
MPMNNNQPPSPTPAQPAAPDLRISKQPTDPKALEAYLRTQPMSPEEREFDRQWRAQTGRPPLGQKQEPHLSRQPTNPAALKEYLRHGPPRTPEQEAKHQTECKELGLPGMSSEE